MMDTEIVRLHREGKRAESLDRFAEKYQARLLALARRLVGNHEDALDALQEILLQVDRSLPKFKGESSLYTWAFRLATNVCLNYQRKTRPDEQPRAARRSVKRCHLAAGCPTR